MSKRIEWIDSARGIAILFVVLGHCIGNIEDPVNKFILAFHMPLFFFLSGLCAKCKGDKAHLHVPRRGAQEHTLPGKRPGTDGGKRKEADAAASALRHQLSGVRVHSQHNRVHIPGLERRRPAHARGIAAAAAAAGCGRVV